jgi:chromosome segregation ATPase
MTKNTNNKKTNVAYCYYSKILNKPFDSIEELAAAEAAYLDEIKAKEEKAAAKKADAQKVEDAFKALNTARKTYKEKLSQLNTEYSETLTELKKAFELGKTDIQNKLAAAEENYSKALKEFTDAHPEGYHLTLKDGDFETTISGNNSKTTTTIEDYADLFKWVFGL